jgi:hypothetical protein
MALAYWMLGFEWKGKTVEVSFLYCCVWMNERKYFTKW